MTEPMATHDGRELARLKRDLADGKISPNAHGATVQRIAELESRPIDPWCPRCGYRESIHGKNRGPYVCR